MTYPMRTSLRRLPWARLALTCAVVLLPAVAAFSRAPLYVYVPQFDVMVASYGRIGADVDPCPEGGLRISGVVPESPAARMGLRPLDRLLAIDGRPIEGLDDALEVLNTKGVADGVTLLVDRQGEQVTFRGVLAPDYQIEAHRRNYLEQAKVHPVTRLTLDVPPDSRVYLNGTLMRQTGYRRSFATTELGPDQRYLSYPVRVEIDRDGRTLSQEHTIDLRAGQSRELVIYFDAPTDRVARRR